MGIDGIFPLTLTLSPGEREQQFGVFRSLQMIRAAGCCRFARRLGTILPLPAGEGRGEGQAALFAVQLDLWNFIYGH
jgi:hypothetical protein